jgi:trehalose/maltose hydrolase-like predicted phosphorylase
MITAKKAKEQIIKSISKSYYIKKIKQHIEDAIDDRFFECTVTITQDDNIDWDMNKTIFHILRYFEYYGYSVTVVKRECDEVVINISWHRI